MMAEKSLMALYRVSPDFLPLMADRLRPRMKASSTAARVQDGVTGFLTKGPPRVAQVGPGPPPGGGASINFGNRFGPCQAGAGSAGEGGKDGLGSGREVSGFLGPGPGPSGGVVHNQSSWGDK